LIDLLNITYAHFEYIRYEFNSRFYYVIYIRPAVAYIYIHIVFRKKKSKMRIIFAISYSFSFFESIKAALLLSTIVTSATNRFPLSIFFFFPFFCDWKIRHYKHTMKTTLIVSHHRTLLLHRVVTKHIYTHTHPNIYTNNMS